MANKPKSVTLLEGIPAKAIVAEIKSTLTKRQIAAIRRELEREDDD